MHLDIHVVDIDAEAERLEGLGARRVSSSPYEESGTRWHLMAEPEGNELCGLYAMKRGTVLSGRLA